MDLTNKNNLIEYVPLPACGVGEDGEILYANELMTEVFPYKDIKGSKFFTLTGEKLSQVKEDFQSGESTIINRNDKYFLLKVGSQKDSTEVVVYFCDVTEREDLKEKIRLGRPAIIFLDIDNYDELVESDNKKTIPATIDSMVRNWAADHNASLTSIEEDEYILFASTQDVNTMIEEEFDILDQVRKIETKIDFPISISIGIGMSENAIVDSKDLANAAMELALGRGGDQAVVKTEDRTRYFGGTLQSMEKNNRGKSRVIAHALKRLINESKNVIIAGHRWPDMDSFGAALGAYRICEYLDKEVHIVVEDYNDALQVIYEHAEETGDYSIIKSKKAMEIATSNTLFIILDNNRPTLVECPELLDVCQRKVVIDHHRLSDTPIEGPTIAYVESYASSTCELITEILQYIAPKRIVNKFESEALLAGIMVDTNSYSVRSGVRTFEAAAWLKRSGADTAQVKRFFQTEITAFQAKAEAVAAAEYTEDGIAYAMTDIYSAEAQIINAQIADELLTVKGVRASFVIGKNDILQTIISARSLGEINVQTIMERFGGGGHLTTAAAQINDKSPEEILEALKGYIKTLMDKEKEADNASQDE